jgi:hypothetical protein
VNELLVGSTTAVDVRDSSAIRTKSLRIASAVSSSTMRVPVRRGQRLGEVQVLDRGRVIARSPLVAASAVGRPGTLGRVGFYAGRTLDHLGGLFG